MRNMNSHTYPPPNLFLKKYMFFMDKICFLTGLLKLFSLVFLALIYHFQLNIKDIQNVSHSMLHIFSFQLSSSYVLLINVLLI